jgi:raffinose/stachyose/melibiose transport system permease protein
MTSRAERLTTYAVLCVFAVIAVFPLLAVASQALQLPHLSFGAFTDAWQRGHFARYLTNSVIVVVVVVLVARWSSRARTCCSICSSPGSWCRPRPL